MIEIDPFLEIKARWAHAGAPAHTVGQCSSLDEFIGVVAHDIGWLISALEATRGQVETYKATTKAALNTTERILGLSGLPLPRRGADCSEPWR